MKRVGSRTGIVALACALGAISAGAARADQALPSPFPEARYRQMSVKSPFAVASASTAAPAATPGFAAQLYVDGAAHIGSTDYAAIKSRDPDVSSVIFLGVGQSTPDGMRVDRIHWSDEMGKTTVDVSKGGEKATLVFDEQQLAKNDGAPAGQVPGGPGGIRMPIYPGQVRQLGFPNPNAMYQPPGGPNAHAALYPQQPGFPNMPGMPNFIGVHRRVRIIQSGQ